MTKHTFTMINSVSLLLSITEVTLLSRSPSQHAHNHMPCYSSVIIAGNPKKGNSCHYSLQSTSCVGELLAWHMYYILLHVNTWNLAPVSEIHFDRHGGNNKPPSVVAAVQAEFTNQYGSLLTYKAVSSPVVIEN